MAEARHSDETSERSGTVIQFPTNRRSSPPPLPPLRHSYPTPGGGFRYTGSHFGAALAVMDRKVA